MASGLGISQPGESLQRNARVWRIFTDQHGRKFGAESDIATSQPIGELMPQGFCPPWQPPMRFATWRRVGELDFRWDYETMAAELSGVTAEYYQDAVKFAIENNKPEPEIGGPVDRTIRYVLGPPPMSPAIPLACEAGDPWMLGVPDAPVTQILKDILQQSAGANSKDALDFIRAKLAKDVGQSAPAVPSTPAVPLVMERARTITDPGPMVDPATVTYKEFVGEAMKRGMAMADAATAWKDHKENLAAEQKVA